MQTHKEILLVKKKEEYKLHVTLKCWVVYWRSWSGVDGWDGQISFNSSMFVQHARVHRRPWHLQALQLSLLPFAGREMSSSLRGEGLVWLIVAVVCLCAAPRVQLFASAGNGWPHNAPWRRWNRVRIFDPWPDPTRPGLDVIRTIST